MPGKCENKVTPQSRTDKWFMRSKDIVLLIGFLGSLFIWVVKYYSLPGEVLAQAADIKNLQTQVISFDKRIDGIQIKQEYTNKSLDDIKSWLKTISNKIN